MTALGWIRRYWAAILFAVFLALSLGGGLLSALIGNVHQPGEKYYDLPAANVAAQVRRDGAVAVRETITFSFHGFFSGAYRDIPVAPGQAIDRIGVSEAGVAYQPGASTELGSFGFPGSFGTATIPGGVRIVWHYSAVDEPRTFTLTYLVHGALTVHPDVVDVQMNAWGSGWPEPLGVLTASIALPAGVKPLDVFGTPAYLEPTTGSRGGVATMTASDIDEHQAAGLRVLLPPEAASGMADVRHDPTPALASIRRQEQDAAEAYASERDRLDTARTLWPLTALVLLAIATVPVGLVILLLHLTHGREFRVDYREQYEREPPSDDPPALVTSLVAQREHVGSREFTATLFDLIQRDVIGTEPASDASLAVKVSGEPTGLAPHEGRVVDIVQKLQKENGGPVELARLGKVARDADLTTRRSLASTYNAFVSSAERAVKQRGWIDASGTTLRWVVAALFALAGIAAVVLWYQTRTPAQPFRDAAELALAGCLFVSALIVMATPRTVFNRRRREAALLGARWDAFRRFLHDFPRFSEAVPAQIEIWERLLVYGIAFGLADRILDEARLRLPPEQLSSGVYPVFIGGWGGDDFGGSLGSSFAAPPSPSSGGGGFSGGGGGGGFGGGGGGAW